jgi:transposase
MPHARFTKEFQDEAVRLALTSGRSRRAIAADLSVGLSTLRHWLDRRREREIDDPPEDRQEDMAAELKRLRSGSTRAQEKPLAFKRQDLPWPKLLRSSLEPTTAFFAKEGSR